MNKFIFTLLCVLLFNISSQAAWKFGLMVGYSPLYTADLSGGGTLSGTPYLQKYDLTYKGSAEFGFDMWNLDKHGWGFISGAQISTQSRELDHGTSNGMPINTNLPSTKFQTSFGYLGAGYKWESFYIPLALTYGVSKIEPIGTTKVDVKTGVGALLGFGYFFSESFAIEYIGRSATMELKMSNASGTQSETTTGAVGAALLNLKYFF